jgi:hypothetical protein
MPLDRHTVAIVVDPEYGAALQALASRMPVWVVDSPVNRSAIEAEWTRRRRDGAEREVTVFRMIEGLSPAEHVAGLLGTIEEHHGPFSQSPPFERLEVFGTTADAALTSAILEAGGSPPVATADGFRTTFSPSRTAEP